VLLNVVITFNVIAYSLNAINTHKLQGAFLCIYKKWPLFDSNWNHFCNSFKQYEM